MIIADEWQEDTRTPLVLVSVKCCTITRTGWAAPMNEIKRTRLFCLRPSWSIWSMVLASQAAVSSTSGGRTNEELVCGDHNTHVCMCVCVCVLPTQGNDIAAISDVGQKLRFYALYKQATAGDVTGSRPNVFDIKGRAKVWQRARIVQSR